MISQGILPFKIEHKEEQITPRSGLALFAEVIRALDVRRKVEGHFPKPGSNRGYEAWSYIEPVLLMLEGGGRHIEDLREIRDDVALRQLVGMGEMPSLSTYGDWLVRMGAGGGVAAIRAVNDEVAETIHRRTGTSDYTLDVDATVIEAEKQEAEWTYKKVRGYQPMLGLLAEAGLCLGYCYYVIATNRDDRSPEEVIRFHNERGQAENEIKELKIGFGMEQMTSGDYRANTVWFGLGVLTYNLTLACKLLFLDAERKTKTVATLRWQLIQTAGRLVRHGRRLVLRLAASWEKFQLYLRIRARLAAFV